MTWRELASFKAQTTFKASAGWSSAVSELGRFLKTVALFVDRRVVSLVYGNLITATCVLLAFLSLVEWLAPEPFKYYIQVSALLPFLLAMTMGIMQEGIMRIRRLVRNRGPKRCAKTGGFCLECDDVCSKIAVENKQPTDTVKT